MDKSHPSYVLHDEMRWHHNITLKEAVAHARRATRNLMVAIALLGYTLGFCSGIVALVLLRQLW